LDDLTYINGFCPLLILKESDFVQQETTCEFVDSNKCWRLWLDDVAASNIEHEFGKSALCTLPSAVLESRYQLRSMTERDAHTLAKTPIHGG